MLQRVFALYQNLRDREKVLVLLAFVSLLIALFSMQSERGNMETVFGGISALAAVGAAFVAWWAIRVQDQRARLTLSVSLINQYIDAFESDRIRTARRNAAEFIVRATTQEGKFKWSLSDDDSELEDLRKVLNLFDHLGTLVRSSAIDERYVWNAFFLWSRCTGLELNRWLSTGERIRTGALFWKTQSILIRPYRITKSTSWFA